MKLGFEGVGIKGAVGFKEVEKRKMRRRAYTLQINLLFGFLSNTMASSSKNP